VSGGTNPLNGAVFGSYAGDKQPTHNILGQPLSWPKEKKMKQLYWVAVLYRKGKKTELILEPEIMLAVSEEKAKAGIINIIPSSYKERFDRLEVVVRPF
jgi:hypothetical protein